MNKKTKKYLIIVLVVLSLLGTYLLCQTLLINSRKEQDVVEKEKRYIENQAKERVMKTINLTLEYFKEVDTTDYQEYVYEENLEYDKLTKNQKVIYDSMLMNVLDFKDFKYEASKVGYDTLDDVLISYGALKLDHPEVEIYFYLKEVVDGDTTTALEAVYYMPGDTSLEKADIVKLKDEIKIFNEEVNLIISSMPSNLNAYDKYRYLATYISLRTTYDNDFKNGNQTINIYGAIASGTSICEGYAKAFKYLCKKANLWCNLVEGTSNGTGHMWNLVKLNDEYYHVDITWSDNQDVAPNSLEWFKYFIVSEDKILLDHEITKM